MFAPLLFVLALTAGDRNAPAALQPIGRLEHPPIREASGIVASRRHRGVFWIHNDSGNPPALFAVKNDGTLLREYLVAVPNIDWEDIAIDDSGRLYIGEIGNNKDRLPIRAFYRLDEPDPSRPVEGPLPVERVWYYRFGPDGRFDAEGLVIDGDRALIVAKTHDGGEAALYAIPLGPTAPMLHPALPERVGTLPDFVEPATGADLDATGQRLAVCSYSVARVYSRASNRWTLLGTVRYEADGIEAIAWAGDDLILAGEGRGLYRIAHPTWSANGPTGVPPDH